MSSKITEAIRQERRERFEQVLKDKEPAEYRDYLAERRNLPEDRRNEVTGY